jgi:UDP-glucose 4-epimerase
MDACGIYNLGSGQGTNITSIIENIKEVTGIDCHVNYTLPKSYDVKNFVLDLCKTKEVIGDFQYIPIKEGITKTWEWLKSSHSVLESLKVTLN